MKPNDTQCSALEANEKGDFARCEMEISFDEVAGHWSVLCLKHRKLDTKARAAGKPRVEKVR